MTEDVLDRTAEAGTYTMAASGPYATAWFEDDPAGGRGARPAAWADPHHHRDAPDFYLTAGDREQERDENLLTASRMFAAMSRSPAGTSVVASAVIEVFPWAPHLPETERTQFATELVAALSDAAELGIDATAPEVIAGWRATARIRADKKLDAQALAPTQGDFGPVEAIR